MSTNPMHQFNVHRIGPEISLGNVDISFTNASLFMMISALTIITIFFVGTKRRTIVPTKITAANAKVTMIWLVTVKE